VEKIAQGKTHAFDVVRVKGDGLRPGLQGMPHYYLNSLSLGFGAAAAYNMTTTPRYLKGILAYLAAIVRTILAYPVLRGRFTIDDQPAFEQASTITAVMNGRCVGNGMWVAPQARADDGCLDMMIAQEVSRFTILRMIPKLMAGTHIHEPVIAMHRLQKLVIESQEPMVVEADGETPFLQARRLEVEVLPGRLQVMV
jgi:diacylglycerol kinase family enzyme